MVTCVQLLSYWLLLEIFQAIGFISEKCGSPNHSCFKLERLRKNLCHRSGYHQLPPSLDVHGPHTPQFFIYCPEMETPPCVCPCLNNAQSTRHHKIRRRLCGGHRRNKNSHITDSVHEEVSYKLEIEDNVTDIIKNCTIHSWQQEHSDLCDTVILQQHAKRSVLLDHKQQENAIETELLALSDPVPIIGWIIALVAIVLVVITVVCVTVLY